MLPHLLIDWNSTIQNQQLGIMRFIKQMYNKQLSYQDFAEWDIDLSDKIGISKDEWLSVWTNEQIFMTSPPYPKAKQALSRLSSRYRIVILTSANCGPQLCKRWFIKQEIPFTEIIWTQNKCHFGGLLIDDSPTVLAKRYEQKLMTIAFSQLWNKEFIKFPKLKGWNYVQIKKD